MDSKTQFWLTNQEIEKIFSSKYWNDEEEEKRKKKWYVVDGNMDKFYNYIINSAYYEEYESVIKFAKNIGLNIEGTGVDIAAGVCWTTALLSKIKTVKKLYALEISRHRLFKIAPIVLDAFTANKEKITRVLGSFYDIKLMTGTVDFCFMSTAFHHADRPERLLSEVRRVLKPSGFVLIIGERPIFPYDFLKRYVKNFIKILMPVSRFKSRAIYKLLPDFGDLYPPDTKGGDHYYRPRDYFRIFQRNNFRLYQNKQSRFINFIAVKE